MNFPERQPYRLHLIVIGLYTLLALALTWPLVTSLATAVPGEATWAFDESTFLWNMSWFKFSLLNLGQSPLESTYIFFPIGVRLTTYTFNMFNAAFGLPLQLALSLPLASNLTLLFSFIASAYGTFLLSLYLLTYPPTRHYPNPPSTIQNSKFKIQNFLAAFAAGAVFAFSASRMMYAALGHYNFVTIHWFPFYTLFLLKTLRQGTWRTAAMAGLFAALCLYAELTFSVFLLFLTLILLLGEWSRHNWSGSFIRHAPRLIRLGLTGLVAFILAAPLLLAVLPDFLDPAFAEPGWGEGLKLSADLVGLVSLTPLHPFSGLDWLAELRAVVEGRGQFSDVNTLFLGYGVLAVAGLGMFTRRSERMWGWSALIFTVLSLGPLLTINGQNRFNLDGIEVTFPLPFTLLHYLPILSANRVPNRFGIPLTLSLAVLVGYGAAWLFHLRFTIDDLRFRTQGNRRRTRGMHEQRPAGAWRTFAIRYSPFAIRAMLYLLLLACLLFDQYSVPLPLSDARIPDVYTQIGAEPGDFSLLQLPLGWRNSYGTLGAEQTQLQYYQAAHHRPILAGNTSRNPAFQFDYYANIPLFFALAETELYRPVDELTLDRARQQAAELMSLYNVKYLVIHHPVPFRKPYEDTYEATRRLALELIPHRPEPAYQSPGVQAFAVEAAPIPDPLVLDFGEWRSDPYRGWGWAGNETVFAATANWAIAPTAQVFFPVRDRGDRHLAITIAPFSYPGAPPQTVGLSLNDHPLAGSFVLAEGWQTVEAVLPEAALRQGLNRLVLTFTAVAQPRQVLPANRAIGGTGLDAPVDLEVNSGADLAYITVGFGQAAADASAHRRGLNIAVIQPQTGEVLARQGFDTAANEFEAAGLRQFIAAIPAGHIVVVTSQGLDAGAFVDAETRASLASLGLAIDSFTPPFSAVGVKGAAPGTALQAGGPGTAYLRLGASPDTRSLAAAVNEVVIRSSKP